MKRGLFSFNTRHLHHSRLLVQGPSALWLALRERLHCATFVGETLCP